MRLVEERRKEHSGKVGESASVKQQAAPNGRVLTGRIMRAKPGVMAGWAIGVDPGEPIRVALLINGTEVAQAVADKPCGGLKEQGIHPTGRCGFTFRFGPGGLLQVGDQVTVKPVDVDFPLIDTCVTL